MLASSIREGQRGFANPWRRVVVRCLAGIVGGMEARHLTLWFESTFLSLQPQHQVLKSVAEGARRPVNFYRELRDRR